ncbi:MAG: hypothetical protein IJ744_07470 [Lachnospiraceae bacterium]|nr:hypothetical protein [Lachnospiraceae bacterium]
MREPKFTFNAFIFIVILFSALYFFANVSLFNLLVPPAINDTHEIENSDYVVRYNTIIPSGIYDGSDSWSHLMIEGEFGYNWGMVAKEDALYCNEYHTTTFAYMTTDLVRIDLKTFEKTIVRKDAMLVGETTSGELIYLDGCVMANWFPATNPLYRLYGAANRSLLKGENGAMVCFYNTGDANVVYQVEDLNALTDARQAYYRSHSLAEVKP